MFIELDKDNGRILSTTIPNIDKNNEFFRDNQKYIWTDKELDNEKLEEGYIPFYNKETDEIQYKIFTEPEIVLSETEEAILNTNINVEYLVALQELNL